MNFAVVLLAALRAPFRDPELGRKALVVGLLSVSQVILIAFVATFPPVALAILAINFVIWGYAYQVFIDGLNGLQEFRLPEWTDWRSYFRVGFWIFVVTLGYVVLFAFGIVAVISITKGGVSSDLQTMTTVGLGSVALFNGISPLVFTRFAEEGRVWACFEPDAIWRDARLVVRLDYVQLCFLYYGLWTMTLIVFGGLPIVGVPVASVCQYFLTLVFSHVFGALVGLRKKGPTVIQQDSDA